MMKPLKRWVSHIEKWKSVYSIRLFSSKVLICAICLGSSFSSCQVESADDVYYVRKTQKKVKINGKNNDRAWKGANELKSFSSPWSDIPMQRTGFKALYDDENFCFLFLMEDDDIIAANDKKDDEENALYSDRAEIFFSANEQMDPYFTLEMDSRGRLFDAAGFKPGSVDQKWDWDASDIKIESQTDGSSYSVEGQISLASLKKLVLIRTDTIYCGIMRAEYSSDSVIQWISWRDPGTKSPNFHHPNIFGRFILQ